MVALAFMAALLSLVVLLLVGFVTAGPEENLAGVLVILAGVLAIPLVVAGLAWTVGCSLRRRAPQAAYVLVVVSVVVGGLGMSLVALSFLPAVRG